MGPESVTPRVRQTRSQRRQGTTTRGTTTTRATSTSKPYCRYQKPPYSYLGMIAAAIATNPNNRMTLKDIVVQLCSMFRFFRESTYRGWKDSVRHNLTQYACFQCVRDPSTPHSKGNHWRVVWERLPVDAFHKQKNLGRSSSEDYVDDLLDYLSSLQISTWVQHPDAVMEDSASGPAPQSDPVQSPEPRDGGTHEALEEEHEESEDDFSGISVDEATQPANTVFAVGHFTLCPLPVAEGCGNVVVPSGGGNSDANSALMLLANLALGYYDKL